MFADDTNIFMSHENINILLVQFNNELKKVNSWLSLNKLSVNISKTQYMIFTNKKISTGDFQVQLANSNIVKTSCVKFLGVVIDDKFLWTHHIDLICNRISKAIGIMYRLHNFPTII